MNFFSRGQAKVLIDPTKHKNQYRRLWPFEAVSDLYAQEFEWLRYEFMFTRHKAM